MIDRTTSFAIAVLASATALAAPAAPGTDAVVETFDDNVLLPTFGRSTSEGWTNVVEDGELVMAKEKGIPGFSAARLNFCETLVGDFSVSVLARKGRGIGSLGIVVLQQEDGWVGFSDIFFAESSISALCGTPETSSASVSAGSATEATFRITRIGQTVTLAYDVGSGFVDLLSGTDTVLDGPMLLGLFHLEQGSDTAPRSGSFDDLQVEADGFGQQGPDLNWDGSIEIGDLLALLAAWGPCPEESCCPADFDQNGEVDVSDLLVVLGAWE